MAFSRFVCWTADHAAEAIAVEIFLSGVGLVHTVVTVIDYPVSVSVQLALVGHIVGVAVTGDCKDIDGTAGVVTTCADQDSISTYTN